MKKSLIITIIGTLIALLAFIVDLFAPKEIAEYLFVIGFVIALVGISISIFSKKEHEVGRNSFWHKLSTIGFLIAGASVLINLYIHDSSIVDVMFKVGALAFACGAIFPILLSFRKNENGG